MTKKFVLCVYKKKERKTYINGKYLKQKMPARLATCLRIEHRLPCPISLLKLSYNKETFEVKVNEIINEVINLSHEISKEGKANFFKYNSSDMFLKKMANYWHLRGDIHINSIIEYIKYKHYEENILSMLEINL